MNESISLYTNPSSMEPLFPEDEKNVLSSLALELIEKSAKLSGTMNPNTRNAISSFLRPMNSYYSNLIEGHNTSPIDIEKALKKDFSDNKEKRDLQKEAKAHIKLHAEIEAELKTENNNTIPSKSEYIKTIHKRFYKHLPETFLNINTENGETKTIIPGKYRIEEVKVGNHIAPHFKCLDDFMSRFEYFYNQSSKPNHFKVKRIISIAASHHRLAWVHPFLDGNGRVVRLFSDACFFYENLDASGLWSISRGLARNKENYYTLLAHADKKRYNNYDGRGNLSDKALFEFCKFFLETAIDQLEYMYSIIDTENMLNRIESFADLMILKKRFKKEAKYILTTVFLKGKMTKTEAMQITNTSDKTLKAITDNLIKMELLESKKIGIHVYYFAKYPIKYSPVLFPGIYPSDRETEMMMNI